MNKNDQKQFRRAWALVPAGSILAFFIGIAANAACSLMVIDSHSRKVMIMFVASFGIFLLIAYYLSFAIENINKFTEMSDW